MAYSIFNFRGGPFYRFPSNPHQEVPACPLMGKLTLGVMRGVTKRSRCLKSLDFLLIRIVARSPDLNIHFLGSSAC